MERTTDSGVLQAKETRLRGLFVEALGGNETSYRVFLSELGAHLRGFLRRRLMQQPGDVEDLVQEVLLAVHNARASYRPDQPVTAWVHAIARHKLTDYFRSRSRSDALNDPLDDAPELFAAPDMEQAQARRDIGQLLEELPDRQRLPILHVKLEGLSVAECARLTGMSDSAVKVGVHRGLRALAAKIRGK
ncbi:MAG TPA: sigma-70 family RNA polymerase sigma factor [Paraburkholderia sp.]|jgi:RNA polymerase sigma-70 factor (ECF subfamily)